MALLRGRSIRWSPIRIPPEAERSKLLVMPLTGAEVADHVAELYRTPADVVVRAKAIAAE